MPVRVEVLNDEGNSPEAAVYVPKLLEIRYAGRIYSILTSLDTARAMTAELRSGRLAVSDSRCTQYCAEKSTGRKRKVPPRQDAAESPPLLELDRILPKCWDFVRRAEAFEGRKLAPLTGSMLEAQLLVSRVDSTRVMEASALPFVNGPILPLPLADVPETKWIEFRKRVFSVE